MAAKSNLRKIESSEYGAILCIPYICTWDMMDHRGLWDALSQLSLPTLQELYVGLKTSWNELSCETFLEKDMLLNQICDPRVWSRIIMYRKAGRVRGAFPAPPFLLQLDVKSASDDTEADLSGPFPFEYYTESGIVVDCALVYVNPNRMFVEGEMPTIDLVPFYSVASGDMRCIRYAALLGEYAPPFAIERVKEVHATFVRRMHLIRQKVKDKKETPENQHRDASISFMSESRKVWKVYTDSNDPLGLGHPQAGLSKDAFILVDNPGDADIIYSYKTLFRDGPLRDAWESRANVLINQFPYEGAFLQKDHLAQEILKQYGLPRPCWAIETYDLDVQLGEFVGAGLLEANRSDQALPLWIVKPAIGTQSQGHVVTRSLGHVIRLVDSGGGSRVAQRYIVRPEFYLMHVFSCYSLIAQLSVDIGEPCVLSRSKG